MVDWLAERGHDADHVIDRFGSGVSDADIWDAAQDEGSVILTKDRDFASWAGSRRKGPQVVWIRLGNTTSQMLQAWLAPRWARIETELKAGVRLLEVGRPVSR